MAKKKFFFVSLQKNTHFSLDKSYSCALYSKKVQKKLSLEG